MRALSFYKYQGTGNDFVMIDNREGIFPKDDLKLISQLCDRRFGIGADGVILVENAENADFEMVYYNPDGSQSLCGNGSRCAVMFAKQLDIISNSTDFLAIDGMHKATIDGDEVQLLMNDVEGYEQINDDFLIDTGSPHYIRYNQNVAALDMITEGQSVRYSDRFKEKGVNVNLIEEVDNSTLKIRTYERGVEGETLSCGTGCTAAALSLGLKNNVEDVTLQAVGGTLKVTFTRDGEGFKNIYLIGPAKRVFAGTISI